MAKSKKRKKWWIATMIVLAIILVFIIVVGICELLVRNNAKNKMYDDVQKVPQTEVGLVLGTSPVSEWTGRRSLYFDRRIDAAAELYKAGKVKRLIVSGGDYRKEGEFGFDEPVAMRDSLIKQGVPTEAIVLDYDGTRTLNSIAKVKDVYGADKVIIISQKYHNERALYQAKYLGVDAIAYNAATPSSRSSWIRNRSRECIARVKLFVDIIRGVKPEFKNQ